MNLYFLNSALSTPPPLSSWDSSHTHMASLEVLPELPLGSPPLCSLLPLLGESRGRSPGLPLPLLLDPSSPKLSIHLIVFFKVRVSGFRKILSISLLNFFLLSMHCFPDFV